MVRGATGASARRLRLGIAGGNVLVAALLVVAVLAAPPANSFRFVILGDRTGEPQAGVYEQIWREAAAGHPAFLLSVGDTIQGLDDGSAESEWRKVEALLAAYRDSLLYLVPGNHDVWSAKSENLFRKYAGHPPHYSFDYQQAHFTILDNSRRDDFSPEEMAFLAQDLKAHAAQPVKFIVSHRPSWLVGVALKDAHLPLHQLARQYGVEYVIAGHVHQMMHLDLESVTYLSMPSSGGHLRLSGKYEDGWFFGHALVEVNGKDVSLQIQEVGEPYGRGRATLLKDWGGAGLARPGH